MTGTTGSRSTDTVISMNDQVNGIVLNQSDYRDHAVLLRVLTREYGILSFTARGARKLTSHNAAHIMPYTEAELTYDHREGKTLFTLKSAHTVQQFKALHASLEAGAAAGVMGELIITAFSDECEDGVYDLLRDGLRLLDQGAKSDLVLGIFLARILVLLGIAPEVDCCVVSGDTSVAAISVEEGGFLSEREAVRLGVPLSSREELRRFRLINHAQMKDYTVLAQYMEDGLAELRILNEFLRRYMNTELASLRFYYSVRTIE